MKSKIDHNLELLKKALDKRKEEIIGGYTEEHHFLPMPMEGKEDNANGQGRYPHKKKSQMKKRGGMILLDDIKPSVGGAKSKRSIVERIETIFDENEIPDFEYESMRKNEGKEIEKNEIKKKESKAKPRGDMGSALKVFNERLSKLRNDYPDLSIAKARKHIKSAKLKSEKDKISFEKALKSVMK